MKDTKTNTEVSLFVPKPFFLMKTSLLTIGGSYWQIFWHHLGIEQQNTARTECPNNVFRILPGFHIHTIKQPDWRVNTQLRRGIPMTLYDHLTVRKTQQWRTMTITHSHRYAHKILRQLTHCPNTSQQIKAYIQGRNPSREARCKNSHGYQRTNHPTIRYKRTGN